MLPEFESATVQAHIACREIGGISAAFRSLGALFAAKGGLSFRPVKFARRAGGDSPIAIASARPNSYAVVNLLLTLVTSVLLGMRHATDPDHIVAVSTIVTRERSVRRAASIGALWGLGHTLTIFVVGGAIIVLKVVFTPRLGLSMEFTVALMLMVLGVLNLFNVQVASSRVAAMRPFFVGIIHGLAGSAAATLLILPLIDDPRWAVLYLVVFGGGTILGMAVITLAIAAPAAYASARVSSVQRWIRVASGGVSLAFGLVLAYKIGITDGLFLAQPHWTPQ